MNNLIPLAGVSKANWLSQLDARCCLMSVLLFSITVMMLDGLASLLLALSAALVLIAGSGVPLKPLLKRVLFFEGFILVLVVFLPFTSLSGMPDGRLLGLFEYHQAGVDKTLQVAIRANAMILTSLILLATLLPEQIGHALARLGLPDKLVQLFLMTVRYVSVLFQEHSRLRTAMKARAFQPKSNIHTWRSYGWLIGMLLVRSLERSERVVQAMKCRGYQGQYYVMDETSWKAHDSAFLVVVVLVSLGLLSFEALSV